MPSSLAPVRALNPSPGPIALFDSPLERVKQQLLRLVPNEGHTSLGVNLCAYRFSRPGAFSKAAAFGVTLGVVVQGRKVVWVGGHPIAVDPWQLVVITRESENDVEVSGATPEEPYLGLSLCFEPEQVARALLALADAGEETKSEPVPAFVTPCDAPIADALERLLRSLADPLERKLLAPLAIDELLFRLLRSDAAAAVRSGVGHAGDAPRILEAMQFMRRHYAQKLSVEELAHRARMSESHFAHRFSAVARISPMRFLREVRLEQARALLLEDGARSNAVANEVGFDSAAHFTREFKRRFGVTPSHYMRGRSPALR